MPASKASTSNGSSFMQHGSPTPQGGLWNSAKKMSLKSLEAGYEGPDSIPPVGTTTLMIRNLDRACTLEDVLRDVQWFGLRSVCNFVYVPWDTRRNCNISYAFLNFVDTAGALRCFYCLSGRNWEHIQRERVCRIARAHVQGLAPNLAHYVINAGFQDSDKNAPAVFDKGNRMDLQLAIKKFCSSELLSQVCEEIRGTKAQATNAQELTAAQPRVHDDRQLSEVSTFQMRADAAVNQDRDCSTPAAVARRFESEFREFCQRAVGVDEPTQFAKPVDGDPSTQFWLRFRQFCKQFAMCNVDIPELCAATQAMSNVQHLRTDGNSRGEHLRQFPMRPGFVADYVPSLGVDSLTSLQPMPEVSPQVLPDQLDSTFTRGCLNLLAAPVQEQTSLLMPATVQHEQAEHLQHCRELTRVLAEMERRRAPVLTSAVRGADLADRSFPGQFGSFRAADNSRSRMFDGSSFSDRSNPFLQSSALGFDACKSYAYLAGGPQHIHSQYAVNSMEDGTTFAC